MSERGNIDREGGALRPSSRRDLEELLQVAVNRSYSDLTRQGRLQFGKNLLKSYLLELDRSARGDDWRDLVSQSGVAIDSTGESDFLSVTRQTKKGVAQLFLDRLSARFVLCHSVSPAGLADATVSRLTSGKWIDSFWLGSGELEQIAGFGTLRGFSTRFDDVYVSETDETDYWLDDDYQAPDALIGVRVQRQEPMILRFVQAMGRLPLSPQQREIALMIAQGRSNQEIAEGLGVSGNTVAYHIKQLFLKLDVHDRAGAIERITAGAERRP